MSGSHFVTTTPRCEPCGRCGRLRIVGLEEGVPYRAEPAPLNATGELRAKLGGRRTYAVISGQLALRTASRIRGDVRRGRPAVFAQHDCRHPATATDIETRHLIIATQLIDTALKPGNKEAAELKATETEHDALFLIANELGGKVIAVNDQPPF